MGSGDWFIGSRPFVSDVVHSAPPAEQPEGAGVSVEKLTFVGLEQSFRWMALGRASFDYSVRKTGQGPPLSGSAGARCQGEGITDPDAPDALCVARLVLKGGTLYWSNRLSHFHQVGKGKILGGTGRFANATGTQTEKRLRTGRPDDVVWTFKIRR